MYRLRENIVWTDTELSLIQPFSHLVSNIAIEWALLHTAWFTRSVLDPNQPGTAIGQVLAETKRGKMLWLMQDAALADTLMLSVLLDQLTVEAGARELQALTAAVVQNEPVFSILRNNGFSHYGWQMPYQATLPYAQAPATTGCWNKSSSKDAFAIMKLQQRIFTPVEKSVLPFADKMLPDYRYMEQGECAGYCFASSFNSQITLTPMFDPRATDPVTALLALIGSVYHSMERVNIIQNSTQEWITSLTESGFQPVGPRRELLVKHLVVRSPAREAVFSSAGNHGQTDIISPIIQNSKPEDNL